MRVLLILFLLSAGADLSIHALGPLLPDTSLRKFSMNKSPHHSQRGIASVASNLPNIGTDAQPGESRDEASTFDYVSEIAKSDKSIHIAATAEELKNDANVEDLIQTRANLLCQSLGAQKQKPYQKCEGYTLSELDNEDERSVVPAMENGLIKFSKMAARTRKIRPESKLDYCKTSFAVVHDQEFCELNPHQSDSFMLRPRRFSEITCLLRDTPFPLEKRKVRRTHPQSLQKVSTTNKQAVTQ